MTVQEMRKSLTNDEFVRWGIYHQRIAQRIEAERMKANA